MKNRLTAPPPSRDAARCAARTPAAAAAARPIVRRAAGTAEGTAVPDSQAAIPSLAPSEQAQAGAAAVPPIVHEVTRQPGRPLDDATRQRFEPGLAADLSGVRIHTGAQAARAAAAIDARAFTVGRDVVFGDGEYRPGTSGGKHLLAHELAHTAQAPPTSGRAISEPGDASERAADAAADALAANRPVTAHAPAAAAIQREPSGDGAPADKSRPSDVLLEHSSPFLAAAAGSTTVDGFDTGKFDLKPEQRTTLAATAHNIRQLLAQYPQSTILVIGHTDTVGTEAHNVELGRLRATTVMAALAALGVPAAAIDYQSAGEGPPQAVATKDETPSAKNRRVEVRFDPKSALPHTLQSTAPILPIPSLSDARRGPARPPLDLQLPPDYDLNRKGPMPDPSIHWRDDYFKPLPPAPKSAPPQSMVDRIAHAIIDPVIDQVTKPLPAKVREFIRGAAHDAMKTGIAKAARSAAERAGVTDSKALDAIEKATEAAIQEKGASP